MRVLAENGAGFDRGWWQRGAELGWTSLLVDERRGGGSISGEGLRDLALVAEEMGAMVSPGPLVATNVVAQTLSREASEELAPHVLPGSVRRVDAAWCVAEPDRDITPDGIGLQARRDGAEFVLDGVKRPWTPAGRPTGSWSRATGPRACPVPRPVVGTRSCGSPARGLDLVRQHAEIGSTRRSRPRPWSVTWVALPCVEAQLRTVLVLQCAEIVGATDRVFDFTVQYAFDRSSFGRALASYQALKHRFADMKLWLESARPSPSTATRAVQDGAPDAGEVVRIAKAYVAERCPELIQDCIQMHGGIGVTWDHDLHLYLRRVVVNRQTYGDPMHQRDHVAILADQIGGRP